MRVPDKWAWRTIEAPNSVGSGYGEAGNNGPHKCDKAGKTSSAELILQQEERFIMLGG